MTGPDREAREAREAARDAIVSAAYGLAGAAEGNVSAERLAEHQAWLCDTYVERLVDAVDAHSALVQGGDRDVIAAHQGGLRDSGRRTASRYVAERATARLLIDEALATAEAVLRARVAAGDTDPTVIAALAAARAELRDRGQRTATGGVMLHPALGGWVAETGEGFWALPTSDRALAQRWADEDESVVDLLTDAGCYATLTEAAAALDDPQDRGDQ